MKQPNSSTAQQPRDEDRIPTSISDGGTDSTPHSMRTSDATLAAEKQPLEAKSTEDDDKSQADLLTEIGMGSYRFMHEGAPYADIRVRGHRETLRIESTAFRKWMRSELFRSTGKAARGESLAQAIDAIIAATEYSHHPPIHPVFLRSCCVDGVIYLDLGDAEWSIIEISPAGWRVVPESPVRFRRTEAMLPFPVPTRTGSIFDLRRFLNVATDAGFVLTVAWLLFALRGQPAFPLMVLLGEAGTGKTTFARVLKALADPNQSPVRTLPGSPQDLYVSAARQRVLAYDNVSFLQPWLSDTLCQLATGAGHGTRTLYTNEEESILKAASPVILNGIEEFVTRTDLADRAVFVTLEPIPEEARESEEEFWAEFSKCAPGILGALLDGAAAGLRNRPGLRLDRLPRMADFAYWATACETEYWPAGTFAAAYADNRGAAASSVLEADVVVSVLLAWFEELGGEWTGTPTQLMAALRTHSEGMSDDPSRSKSWPASARNLAGRIRRAAPALRKIGLTVSVERPERQHRTIVALRPATVPGDGAKDAIGARGEASVRQLRRVPPNPSSAPPTPRTADGLWDWSTASVTEPFGFDDGGEL